MTRGRRYVDHRVEPGERDVEERPLVIKVALKYDRVKMRVPAEDIVDQSGHVGEQSPIVAKDGRSGFGTVKTNCRCGRLRRTSLVRCSR